ncbi:MAG TPA: ribokinase [Spirochaetaceae bacterium]|nr:ribokinase [Spirochaetaceae bacterium]
MKVLVFGSINIDETYLVDHIVRPGETLQSKGFSRNAGGKGANQAAALAATGIGVCLAGTIGKDGLWVLDEVGKFKVNCDLVCIDENVSTGKATIMVSDEGENSILLYAGCNHLIDEEYADSVLAKFGKGDWVVVQNEISCTPHIIRKAHDLGLKVLFNPSPYDANMRCDYNIALTDVLIANETEACALCGLPSGSLKGIDDAAGIETVSSRLKVLCPNACIVVTMGASGSICFFGEKSAADMSGELFKQDACKVKAVDTTAAGDTFLGYFLSSYLKHGNPARALEAASEAASVAVTKKGAMKSIPIGLET